MKTKFVVDMVFTGCMKCCIKSGSPECHAAECLSRQREDGLNGHFEEVKRKKPKLTADQIKSVEHALEHLMHNGIANPDNGARVAWYKGKRADFVARHFVARHKKSIKFLNLLLGKE